MGDVGNDAGDDVYGWTEFEAHAVLAQEVDERGLGGAGGVTQFDAVSDAIRLNVFEHAQHALRTAAGTFANVIGDLQSGCTRLVHHGGGFAEPVGVEFEGAGFGSGHVDANDATGSVQGSTAAPFDGGFDDLPVGVEGEVASERENDAGGDAVVEGGAFEALDDGEDDGVHGVESMAHAFVGIEAQFEGGDFGASVGFCDDLIGGDVGGGGGGLDFFGDLKVTTEEIVEGFDFVGTRGEGVVEGGKIDKLGLQSVVAEGFPEDGGRDGTAEVDVKVLHVRELLQ